MLICFGESMSYIWSGNKKIWIVVNSEGTEVCLTVRTFTHWNNLWLNLMSWPPLCLVDVKTKNSSSLKKLRNSYQLVFLLCSLLLCGVLKAQRKGWDSESMSQDSHICCICCICIRRKHFTCKPTVSAGCWFSTKGTVFCKFSLLNDVYTCQQVRVKLCDFALGA